MITDDRSYTKTERKKRAEKTFLSADEKVGKYNTKNGEEKEGTYDNLDGNIRRRKDRMFDQYEEKGIERENRKMESKRSTRNEDIENENIYKNEKRNEKSSEKRDERRKNKIDNDISDNTNIITAIVSRLNVVESQAKRTR
jgi:hypothetical protein